MSHNTRFIAAPDGTGLVYKLRRIADGKFKQVYSTSEPNTDADRWGHTYDRVYTDRAAAEAQVKKERVGVEVVPFVLIEAPANKAQALAQAKFDAAMLNAIAAKLQADGGSVEGDDGWSFSNRQCVELLQDLASGAEDETQ